MKNMKTLIITAHPASWGFAHKIAETYKETKEKKGGEVEIIELYKQDRQKGFLDFEAMQDMVTTDDQKFYQDKIRWADELVFAFPVWWMWCPAILKNWIDWNMASGFAFKYDENGKHHTLLDGKTARVFMTADGPDFLYKALVKPMFSMLWGKGILGYTGIKMTSMDVFSAMVKKRNDADREKMLEKVVKRAR